MSWPVFIFPAPFFWLLQRYGMGMERLTEICDYRLTHNEPWCVAILGHGRGIFAPGHSSDRARSPIGDSRTEPWMYVHPLTTLL